MYIYIYLYIYIHMYTAVILRQPKDVWTERTPSKVSRRSSDATLPHFWRWSTMPDLFFRKNCARKHALLHSHFLFNSSICHKWNQHMRKSSRNIILRASSTRLGSPNQKRMACGNIYNTAGKKLRQMISSTAQKIPTLQYVGYEICMQ